MPDACPDCGAEVAFEVRAAQVRTGTCAACHHAFAIVGSSEEFVPEGGLAPPRAESAPAPSGGPECEECGGPLVIRSTLDGGLEATCSTCETRAVFVPADAVARAPTNDRRPPRGPRPDRVGSPYGRPARPCRECGGPLRFSTDPEGRVVGECGSCGNRFVLPPRREESPRGPPRFVSRPGGGYATRYPRDRPRTAGGPRRGRPRYDRRSGEDDEDDDRRERRRPRRREY